MLIKSFRSERKYLGQSASVDDLRLTFEIFHDIQELVVNIRVSRELDLDLIEVAKSVLERETHC